MSATPAQDQAGRCPGCGSPSFDGEMCFRKGCGYMAGSGREVNLTKSRQSRRKGWRCAFCPFTMPYPAGRAIAKHMREAHGSGVDGGATPGTKLHTSAPAPREAPGTAVAGVCGACCQPLPSDGERLMEQTLIRRGVPAQMARALARTSGMLQRLTHLVQAVGVAGGK
jgi:hypothetical protein